MRIALIRPGIHQTDIDFSNALSYYGYEVFLMIPKYSKVICPPKKINFKIVKYETYNRRILKSYPLPKKITELIKIIKPVVVQPNEDFQAYSWILRRYCIKNKTKMVLIEEKYTCPTLFNWMAIKIIDCIGMSKNVWKYSSAVISHGSQTTRFIKKRGFRGMATYLPICVNTENFPAKTYSKARKTLKLITVARFIPHKGLDVLIKSLRGLDDIHLTIVGQGKLTSKILALIKRLKLEEKVKIIPKIAHNKIYKIFHNSDIYVCPSRREVASTTIPEAMSCGLPVIVTDAGSSKDFIKKGINGFVFKSEDYEDLQKKIMFFLENPEMTSKMGRESSKIARKELEWKKRIEDYVRIIEGGVK